MVVEFTSSKPITQIKLKPKNQLTFQQLPKAKGDVVHFSANDKETKPAAEKVKVLPNLMKGFIKPIKDIFKSLIDAPLATGVVIAATAAAIAVFPIVGTALAVGICAFGAGKIAMGTVSAIKQSGKGEVEKANNSIQQVGEGVFDVALTANAAISGLKKVGQTVKAVGEAVKEATAKGGQLGIFEKLYAFVQQIQKSETIPQGPKNLNEFVTKIKENAVKELAALKETISNGGKKVSVPEIEEVLNKVESLKGKQVDQAAKAFEQIAAALKDGSGKDWLQQAAGWLQNNQVDKVVANKSAIIEALQKSNVDSILRDPEIIKIVNQVMKSTNPNEAVSLIRKIAGAPETEEAVKVIAGADAVTGTEEPK